MDGNPYITNIPLFTTDNGVDAVRAINEISECENQYVLCQGAIQNFFVAKQASPSPEMTAYMNRWMTLYNNAKYDDRLALKMFRILRMSLDASDGVQIPMLNVWIRNISDGTDAAKELAENGCSFGINKANITGLVYMPPSLRINDDGASGRIHFKVRVKRNDAEGQRIPIAQQAKEGYDIINVIYFGKDAIRLFEEVRQGYPVKVEGSLENYKFYRRIFVNSIEQKELAELLGCGVWDEPVQDIVRFVEREKIVETVPSHNILAQEIRTDYENWA